MESAIPVPATFANQRPKLNGKLIPFLIQFIGLAIVIFGVTFWAFTNRESALIIGAGMTLAGVGEIRRLHITLIQDAKDKARNGSD